MKVVIALGGNALGFTPEEQMEAAKEAAKSIVDLIEQEHDVILVHGNGPQVGIIKNAFEEASIYDSKIPSMPLAECVAMSQGYIGYHLQNAIKNELNNRKLHKEVASIITQVVVNKNDPAFDYPSKPIGNFHTKDEADLLKEKQNIILVEDSGRGYRLVVPSPKPVDLIEKDIIKHLLDQKIVIITGGGGGIPVVLDKDSYIGVQAVIDKDSIASKLALIVEADLFVLLTAVNRVCINFGKHNQEEIIKMSTKQARKFIEEGKFPPGSMLQTIESAIDFADNTNF